MRLAEILPLGSTEFEPSLIDQLLSNRKELSAKKIPQELKISSVIVSPSE